MQSTEQLHCVFILFPVNVAKKSINQMFCTTNKV